MENYWEEKNNMHVRRFSRFLFSLFIADCDVSKSSVMAPSSVVVPNRLSRRSRLGASWNEVHNAERRGRL